MKQTQPLPPGLNEELPDSPRPSAVRALPAGARLDGFDVEALICEGNVSIVYWATDRALAVPVAIAEYMPAQLAQRNEDWQVTPQTSAQADAFAKGLKAFINETRTLARCNHPSLVRIVRLFEANATAYRVMPRYPAQRLLDVRAAMNEPPDEEAVRALLDALLGALQAFHLAGGVHGKVSPSNILLLADNQPLLLGPGAAGRAIASDRIDALKTSGEPCFAPIEQLVEADTPLPPSVDLYALAGVARYWMSGELPPPAFSASSTARHETLGDMVQRLRLTWPRLHYSAYLLDALDNALSIYPAQRPQSVAQMRVRLGSAPPSASEAVSAESTAAPVRNDDVPPSPEPAPEPAPPALVAEEFDAAMAFSPAADPLANSGDLRFDDDRPVRATFARQVSAPRRIAVWIGAVLLVGLLLGGMYEFRHEPQVGRVLEVLGIGPGTGDSAAVSASAVGRSAPETPPMVADSGATKPVPTERATADSPAGAAEPAPPATAPMAKDAGEAKAMPAEPNAADSTTAVTQPPASTPDPTRTAQQRVARAPASPREVCGARTQFSLYRCMQTQCSQRQWVSHAQCERLRTTDSVD